MVAGTYEISFLVLKNIINIIQHSKRDFVSPRGRVLSSIYQFSIYQISE